MTGRFRREAPATTRALSTAQSRTVERLRRAAELLGDLGIAAACDRALAGDGAAIEFCLEWSLEMDGQT